VIRFISCGSRVTYLCRRYINGAPEQLNLNVCAYFAQLRASLIAFISMSCSLSALSHRRHCCSSASLFCSSTLSSVSQFSQHVSGRKLAQDSPLVLKGRREASVLGTSQRSRQAAARLPALSVQPLFVNLAHPYGAPVLLSA
jgi:hypothetical protein